MRYFILLALLLWPTIGILAQPIEQDFAGITFVKIDAQTFTFGSPALQQDRSDTERQRVVPLSHTFWMSKYEISQGEWVDVMGLNPSTFKQLGPDMTAPVETITWFQARAFVDALNQDAGANHFRLPTEAEWEYVAKAGTDTSWSFGDQLESLNLYAHRDGFKYPRSRGLKAPNPWGVYDLYGNVNEWCEDWYQSFIPLDRGRCTPTEGTYKVIRGGSNGVNMRWLRSSSRNLLRPDHKGFHTGLRLVYVEDPANDPFQPDVPCVEVGFCGDHQQGANEECDDGNLVDGDGCSGQCLLEGEGQPEEEADQGDDAGVCLVNHGGCGPSELFDCSDDGQGNAICTPLIDLYEYPLPEDSTADNTYRILIVMVNTTGEIPDRVEPDAAGRQLYYNGQDLGDIYFESATGVRSFLKEASYGTLDVSGTVVGWFHTEPEEISGIDMLHRKNEFIEPACHIVDCSEYDIFVLNGLVTGQGTQIGWGLQNSLNVAQGNFSNVGFNYMINSTVLHHGDAYSDGLLTPSASWPHELLHTFGIAGHANSIWCSQNGVNTTLDGECENKGYGGVFSLMGERAFATHPNIVMKKELGWLSPEHLDEIDVTGSFTSTRRTIYPLVPDDSQLKGVSVRLPRPVVAAGLELDRIHFEYRTPVGLDSYLTRLDGPNAPDGGSFLARYTDLVDIDRVGIHIFLDMEFAGADSTWDIDTHPDTSFNPDRGIKWQGNPGRFADSMLNVGETLSADALLDIEIEVIGLTPDGGIEVEVRCVGDRCGGGLCGENEHVQNGECVYCPLGTTRPAGDDPTAGQTTCLDIACPANSTGSSVAEGCTCNFAEGWFGLIQPQRYTPGFNGSCDTL